MSPERFLQVLARNVEALRHDRGLSRGDLADLADVTPDQVDVILEGRVWPRSSTLFRTAAALEVSVGWLIHYGESIHYVSGRDRIR